MRKTFQRSGWKSIPVDIYVTYKFYDSWRIPSLHKTRLIIRLAAHHRKCFDAFELRKTMLHLMASIF